MDKRIGGASHVASLLRDALAKSGLTYEEVAEQAGVDPEKVRLLITEGMTESELDAEVFGS